MRSGCHQSTMLATAFWLTSRVTLDVNDVALAFGILDMVALSGALVRATPEVDK